MLTQSNVMTGLVNVSVHTMYASTPASMAWLTGYMALVSGVAPAWLQRLST